MKRFAFFIQEKMNRHPILVLSFLMTCTSLFIFFQFIFAKQPFIFGDIGADTENVYYPFFLSLYRKLQEGDFSLWDFSYGLGVNILNRQTDVTNIFTYVTFLFGAGGIKYGLVFAHILKILSLGYLCYWYLNFFQYKPVIKVLVSYVFAFNGFILLWGQHYCLGNAVICIVLMFCSIELAFRSNKGYLLTAFATFFSMFTGYYFAYMVLLLSAAYVLFRLAYLYSWKEFKTILGKSFGLLGGVFVGALMAAFVFVPSVVLVITTSERLNNSVSIWQKLRETFFAPYDQTTFWSIISRMFSNNLMGTSDFTGPLNYYELPQWFFTSFLIFLGFIFAFNVIVDKRECLKKRVIKALCVMLFLFTAFHPLISLAFNGFMYTFFRYTYVFMPILGLLYADVLEKIIENKLKYAKYQITISGMLTMAILLASIYKVCATGRYIELLGYLYVLMLAGFIMVSLLMQTERQNKVFRMVCVTSIAVLIITNVSLEGFVTNHRRTLTSQIKPQIYHTSGNDAVRDILAELKTNDDSFYRVEKTYQDIAFLNDSMLQGYYGISVYNSVINKHIIEFKEQMCPEFQTTQANGYYDFRNIVENVDIVSLTGVKYILTPEYITDIPEYEYMETKDGIHIYRNTQTDGIAKFFASSIGYEEFLKLDEDDKDTVIRDSVVIHGLTETTNHEAKGKSVVEFERPKNSSLIEGTVDAKQDGWVFFSIPYEDGWTAYVDGVETAIRQADIAFFAVEVNEGNHTITLQYKTPYLTEGIVISCVGVLLFAVWCVGIICYDKKIQLRRKN